MNASAQRFLFVVRRAPLIGALAKECLDLMLSVAAFDQWVRVLFIDDGVFQLLPDQPGVQIPKLLEYYDVQEVLVESESLHARGIDAGDLRISAAVIPADEVRDLWCQHDRVVVC